MSKGTGAVASIRTRAAAPLATRRVYPRVMNPCRSSEPPPETNLHSPAAHEELCRQAYARYSDGDFEGLLELFDPAVEVYVAPPNFESGTYRGHSEYRGLIERWGAVWDEMRILVRSMELAGDWILASVEYVGRGKGIRTRGDAAVLGGFPLGGRPVHAVRGLLERRGWGARVRRARGGLSRVGRGDGPGEPRSFVSEASR